MGQSGSGAEGPVLVSNDAVEAMTARALACISHAIASIVCIRFSCNYGHQDSISGSELFERGGRSHGSIGCCAVVISQCHVVINSNKQWLDVECSEP